MSTNTKQKTQAKKPRRTFAAREKCEAVLAVWSERRKPAEVCREMQIPWQQLTNWQDSAMKGMMQAFDPRRSPDGQRLAPLSPRVEKLLAKADVAITPLQEDLVRAIPNAIRKHRERGRRLRLEGTLDSRAKWLSSPHQRG